ncbi:MAG: hypothetical protein IPL39_24410 [Opitutaceae bacterium]|nr:hypothetical protein [Opitutaceae bacterium]
MPTRQQPLSPTKRKPAYPIVPALRDYLAHYRRDQELPVLYRDLSYFRESIPLLDSAGESTLWETVLYDRHDMERLNAGLTRLYALLRVQGDLSLMQHLYVDRIDYCTFGNSLPFRIRIVNSYNDNQDYFYLKKADASRVFGLELEHLLSPNRMNFLTCGETLVEEHVIGIPGDVFIDQWLPRGDLKAVRVAKELVKFNERCFIRLLGDMRAYNFVALVVPDFDEPTIRFRAMDFDQQSYSPRKNFYRPQFFPENRHLALFCMRHLNPTTALQYQREEQTLIIQRADLIRERLERLLDAMAKQELAPGDHVVQLRTALAEHYANPDFLVCESMGDLIRESLTSVRRGLKRATGPESPRDFAFKD